MQKTGYQIYIDSHTHTTEPSFHSIKSLCVCVCVAERESMSDSVPTAQAVHMGGRDLATDEASAWNHPSATLQVFPMIILLALSADLWFFLWAF